MMTAADNYTPALSIYKLFRGRATPQPAAAATSL